MHSFSRMLLLLIVVPLSHQSRILLALPCFWWEHTEDNSGGSELEKVREWRQLNELKDALPRDSHSIEVEQGPPKQQFLSMLTAH